ncbi:ABC transporter substrate-binding protein [Aquibacillus albus]|uniref:NitT/TauT family transport system substrate-binding protein n=1 Tax=Aquibacillus albus TaxID=1168171 RepID=A0ABS2MZ07_9BACI|nr:ABC transporter substrate-binding protein [Aquibacillus albus]MBM7571131.1 NitT/TauT family transport system substrate-binding protein [Aquibacillus albus]
MKVTVKKSYLLLVSILFALLLAACSGEAESSSPDSSESEGTDTSSSSDSEAQEGSEEVSLESVKIVLNWFSKAQHGGVYAARERGIFEENGLEVEIEPGGPQVSSIQMVASGSSEFGLAHADQMVIAKNQGIDLVAVATAMQGSPQAFMFHEGEGVTDFEELNGRTAYIQPGITYWDYLKSKYDLSGVEEISYTGDHANFINDPSSVSQAFVTSEPYFLGEEGIETETLLISEAGYDPYNIVLYVTRDYLESNEETVQKMVTSFVKGWNSYKDSPDEITEVINEANPDISFEAFKFEQETQEEFIYGGDAAEHGVGYMSEERWQTLIDQLAELGLLEETFDANEIFTTEYLPEN